LSGELLSVHKKVGKYNGWIKKERIRGYLAYRLNIIPEKEKDLSYQITYFLPSTYDNNNLPLLVGTDIINEQKTQPDWLNALNNALADCTNNNWKEFINQAKNNGIDDSSISQTIKNLGILQ
jgi:hypothetical protein